MKSKYCGLSLLLFFIINPADIPAQYGPFGIQYHIGLSHPTSRDGGWDYRKDGVMLGAGLVYRLLPRLFVQGNFSYNFYTFNEDFFFENWEFIEQPLQIESDPTAVVTSTIGIKWHLTSSESGFYLFGDIGVFWSLMPDIKLLFSSETLIRNRERNAGISFDFGLGSTVKLTDRWTLFIDTGYRSHMRRDLSPLR
jgi:hypothetical protein